MRIDVLVRSVQHGCTPLIDTMAQRERTARRAAPLGQWARIIWLDGEIRSDRHPNARGLQEQFEISRRSAFSAISFLRDSLDAPLRYSVRRKGYFYEDPTYVLPAVWLREGEFLALLLAQQVSRQYLGTPLEGPLRAAIEKVTRYLPAEVRVQFQEVADAVQFAGGSSVEVPLRLMSEVHRAVRERCLLRILYYTASRDDLRERDVEPHFLTNVRGDWMLVAWDRGRNEDRVFMLARIRECQVLDERFTLRPELSPQRYSRHTFLTDHGGEPFTVALRFDAYQARWIRERVWHPTQTLEEEPGGGVILRLTVGGEGDLTRWVLGYGSHVEVLEPAWLRERVAAEARRMGAVYER